MDKITISFTIEELKELSDVFKKSDVLSKYFTIISKSPFKIDTPNLAIITGSYKIVKAYEKEALAYTEWGN